MCDGSIKMTGSPSHGICDHQQETKSASIGKENQDSNLNVAIKNDQRCAECGQPLANSSHIIDIGQSCTRWHPECFKCAICQEPMDREQSCHLYKDQVICRQDFSRLKHNNATLCARCGWPISANDWVHRAASHVYHIACFNCDICLRQLNTGEQFIICPQHRTNPDDQQEESAHVRLLCRQHFNVDTDSKHTKQGPRSDSSDHLATDDCRKSDTPGQDENRTHRCYRKNRYRQHEHPQYSQLLDMSTVRVASPGSSPTNNDQPDRPDRESRLNELIFAERRHRDPTIAPAISAGEHAINENRRLVVSTSSAGHLASSSTSSSSSTTSSVHTGDYLSPMTPTNSGQGLPCKSKRVRTTFTEDQLSILQTHFQIDSNPDGQDLERIATITGLSKRVTQVWFQNSRARQKKYLIKKKPILSSSITDSISGFSMSGPVTRQAFQPMDLYSEFTEPEVAKQQIESARIDLTRGWCQAISKTPKREDSVSSQIPMEHQGDLRNSKRDTISKDLDPSSSSEDNE